MSQNLASFENPVFKSYIFWSSVLVLKMLIMSILTGLQRFRTQTFANPEDLPSKKLKVKFDDPNVERVRRAHRNDLENILPYFVISYFYILTNPTAFIAINLFRAVAASRILHTVVYAIVPLPQPSRALAFFVCLGISFYMSFHTILHTFKV